MAKRLSYAYLDTGALYRAVAWKIRKERLDPTNPDSLEAVLSHTEIRVIPRVNGSFISVDGQEVGASALRTPEVSQLASTVAAIPQVRVWLLPVQRSFAEKGGVVAEGRDMGTRVFPDADVKFFLDADLSVRAERRRNELAENGEIYSLQVVQENMAERDARDRTRAIDPLCPAEGAIMIDTSNQSAGEVVDKMMSVIAARL